MKRQFFLLILLGLTSLHLFAEDPNAEKQTIRYRNIGELEFTFPKGFDYYLAVPHFTNGPRISTNSKTARFNIDVVERSF